MEAIIFVVVFLEVVTNVNFLKNQSFSTHFSNVINKVKLFTKYARLQGHKVQNAGFREKVRLSEILMWNIKALVF